MFAVGHVNGQQAATVEEAHRGKIHVAAKQNFAGCRVLAIDHRRRAAADLRKVVSIAQQQKSELILACPAAAFSSVRWSAGNRSAIIDPTLSSTQPRPACRSRSKSPAGQPCVREKRPKAYQSDPPSLQAYRGQLAPVLCQCDGAPLGHVSPARRQTGRPRSFAPRKRLPESKSRRPAATWAKTFRDNACSWFSQNESTVHDWQILSERPRCKRRRRPLTHHRKPRWIRPPAGWRKRNRKGRVLRASRLAASGF